MCYIWSKIRYDYSKKKKFTTTSKQNKRKTQIFITIFISKKKLSGDRKQANKLLFTLPI